MNEGPIEGAWGTRFERKIVRFPAEAGKSSDNAPLSAARKQPICSGFQAETLSPLNARADQTRYLRAERRTKRQRSSLSDMVRCSTGEIGFSQQAWPSVVGARTTLAMLPWS